MIIRTVKRAAITTGLIALTLGFVSCGEDDDDDDTAAETTPTANPNATQALNQLTDGVPSLLLNATSSIIQSANIGSTNFSLTSGLGLLNTAQSSNDSLCSENGEPWDAANNQVKQTGEDYISHLFYCKVNSGTIESVDTIPGAIRQIQSILCSVEASFGVTADSYTSEGQENVTDSQTSIELSEACWPQGTPGGAPTTIPFESLVTTALAADSGWQYQLVMKSAAADLDYTLRFFNSNGVFGFMTRSPGNAPGVGSSQTVTVDTNQGVLLYNEIEDRNGSGGSDSVYRGLSRIRVKGAMGEGLTFSEIEEAKAYLYFSGPDFDATDNQDHVYSVYTVSGNNTAGWQFKQFRTTEQDNTTVTEASSQCKDGDGSCSASSDIATTAAMTEYFKGPASVRSGWTTYMTGKPMCEPAENGNDAIDLSAAPASTGDLGACAE